MNVTLNCCKPVGFKTLFKGKDAPVAPVAPVKTEAKTDVKPQASAQAPKQAEAQPKLAQQPQKDTVEISSKKPEVKCEGANCKK